MYFLDLLEFDLDVVDVWKLCIIGPHLNEANGETNQRIGEKKEREENENRRTVRSIGTKQASGKCRPVSDGIVAFFLRIHL